MNKCRKHFLQSETRALGLHMCKAVALPSQQSTGPMEMPSLNKGSAFVHEGIAVYTIRRLTNKSAMIMKETNAIMRDGVP